MPGGDGSARFPLRGLQDAVAAVASVTGPVVIKVEPGDYVLADSLIIERSFIELSGSTEIVQDDHGWPTGKSVAGTETRMALRITSGQLDAAPTRFDRARLESQRLDRIPCDRSSFLARFR